MNYKIKDGVVVVGKVEIGTVKPMTNNIRVAIGREVEYVPLDTVGLTETVEQVVAKQVKAYCPFTNVLGFSDIRTLFDPVQSHAVYGVPKRHEQAVKAELKRLKATRLRVVRTVTDLVIVCFKVNI